VLTEHVIDVGITAEASIGPQDHPLALLWREGQEVL